MPSPDIQSLTQPPPPAEQISPNAASTDRPAGRGFSLNVTLRLWPFVLAVDVIPLSRADTSSEYTT